MPAGAADFRMRMSGVLAAMAVDLRARVVDDRDDEDRWPKARFLCCDLLAVECSSLAQSWRHQAGRGSLCGYGLCHQLLEATIGRAQQHHMSDTVHLIG